MGIRKKRGRFIQGKWYHRPEIPFQGGVERKREDVLGRIEILQKNVDRKTRAKKRRRKGGGKGGRATKTERGD